MMNGIPYELVLVVLFRLIQIALALLLVGLVIHYWYKKSKRVKFNKSKSLK